jgi:hypothetical protein
VDLTLPTVLYQIAAPPHSLFGAGPRSHRWGGAVFHFRPPHSRGENVVSLSFVQPYTTPLPHLSRGTYLVWRCLPTKSG